MLETMDAHTPYPDLPEGYRMTELGPLPEEWQVVRLGEVFSLAPRKQREQVVKDEATYRLVTVRLYAKGLTLRSVQRGKDIGTKKLYMVREGDFIFSKIDARNGAWGFVGKDLDASFVSGDFPILTLKRESADQDFLMFCLSRSSTWGVLRQVAVGTTNRRRVQPRDLLSAFPIPLPPLPEQRAIAHVLRTVQAAREATERVIAAARELKKSLMRHLFTWGPVPLNETERVPTQETEIGTLPAHWKVVRVGDLGEIVTGTTPSTKKPEYYGGLHMFISPGDLGNSMYVERTVKYLSQAGLTVSRPLPKDAVLVVCIGATIGKVGMTPCDNCATNQQINAIIVNKRVNPHYLYFALSHRASELPLLAGRAAVPIVNKSNFSNFLVPLPPLSEQQEIARILRSVDEKIRAEEAYRDALGGLFKTLLHQLMTAQIRLPAGIIQLFAEVTE